MATSSLYRSFTAKEKLRIIEEAENIGNRAVGRKYDVSESCIRDWRKNKTRLTETNSNRRAFRGQKAKHPELEKRLCDYVDDKRQYGCAVTSETCQLKALTISKKLGITVGLGRSNIASSRTSLVWNFKDYVGSLGDSRVDRRT